MHRQTTTHGRMPIVSAYVNFDKGEGRELEKGKKKIRDSRIRLDGLVENLSLTIEDEKGHSSD